MGPLLLCCWAAVLRLATSSQHPLLTLLSCRRSFLAASPITPHPPTPTTADAFGVDEEDNFSDRYGTQFAERILELGRVTKVRSAGLCWCMCVCDWSWSSLLRQQPSCVPCCVLYTCIALAACQHTTPQPSHCFSVLPWYLTSYH